MGVKCSNFEYEIVLQLFKLLAQRAHALWSTCVSREMELLLHGVQMIYQGEGQGVLVPPQVIWTAAVDEVFGEWNLMTRSYK